VRITAGTLLRSWRRPGGRCQVPGTRGPPGPRERLAYALSSRPAIWPSGSPKRRILGLGGCLSAPGSYFGSGSARPGSTGKSCA